MRRNGGERSVGYQARREPAPGDILAKTPANSNERELMKVHEVMTCELVTVQTHDTIEELESLMAEVEVHALPILNEEGMAIGIVTSSDCLPDLPRSTPAADLLSDQVYEVDQDADAKEAAQMMRDLNVHHLVVTDGGQAIGMLSSFDLLRVITGEAA